MHSVIRRRLGVHDAEWGVAAAHSAAEQWADLAERPEAPAQM